MQSECKCSEYILKLEQSDSRISTAEKGLFETKTKLEEIDELFGPQIEELRRKKNKKDKEDNLNIYHWYDYTETKEDGSTVNHSRLYHKIG